MSKFKDFKLSPQTGFLASVNMAQPFCENDSWYFKLNTAERKAIDTYIRLHIGNRDVLDILDPTVEDDYKIISDQIRAYEYKLNTLYDTTQYGDEYIPTDNVFEERTETTTVTRTYGNIQTTDITGARNESTQYGSVLTTNVIADRTNGYTSGSQSNSGSVTDNIGAVANTDKIGSGTDTVTHSESVSPIDDTDYSKASNKDVTQTSIGEKTNTHNETARVNSTTTSESIGSKTDSESIGGGTDTSTIGSHTDTYTTQSTTDTSSTTHGNDTETTTYTVKRHGNVGTISSAELLRQEREIASNYVFFDSVVEVLLHELAKSFIWEV
ncbi:MAG: hypothetical protein MJZ37_08415 [Bacilli bacterium]|nr:hypothetical protein [Bacilli bacterium]